MTNAIPSRLGFTDGSSDGTFAQDNELFLKVMGGEVLTAFRETNVMEDKHMVRTISSGKSAQFPALWKANASYHTPGNEILGQVINHNEVVINIDDLLISDAFIADIDEAKNHYDVRSEYSFQLGAALAKRYDQNLLQLACLAARAPATVSGGYGGSQLTNANFGTDGSALAGGIFDGARLFDEKDVPEDNRYFACRPAEYYLMVRTTDIINRDWGGKGAYAEGEVLKVAGVHIVKTNNLPNSNIPAKSGENNTYSGNFTTTKGVLFHRTTLGTVKLRDLMIESEYDIRRQGTLMIAKYAIGHGFLRPEAAVELVTA